MPDTVGKTRTVAHKTKKPVRRRNLRKWLMFFTVFCLLLIGGVAGAIYLKIDNALDTVTSPQDGYVSPASVNIDPTYHNDKPLSLVILGSDSRPETGSMNTDVMIVAVANPTTKKVTMVSLPRDTRVKIPGYRDYHKINSVFANGEAERRQAERKKQIPTEDGISLTKKTLTELLGIPIDHYVAVDFDGFKAVIDELGGVEVNVDRKLVYDDPTDNTHINLNPGVQVLNGEQALGYVRHRHDNRGTKYYSSDFDRNRRQQEVIAAVINKVGSLEGLTKIFSIMDVGAKHIHTDLSKEQIKGLAYDFKGLNSASVTTLDNGAYWQGSYTFLPKENLNSIRAALQTEMGQTESIVAKLNDSPILAAGDDSYASSKPRTTKKTSESAASSQPAKPKKEQAASKPKETQPDTAEADETVAPPPDIMAPDDNQQSGQTTPPPDATTPGSGATPGNGSTPPPDIVQPTPTPAPSQEMTPPPAGEGEKTTS
ncbi:LCP family protein [Brevibacillus borstelensis]|uniref:LCP family protein n=1 Tax=Brevibacillus borstelensis TaxID=45462 RepID=UPI00203B1E4D|nr:LCP family protein [Brevibacillus borstelensis]MCM3624090.1 LCP family protein [Brevibacillus borstelensis]MED1872863.1 LCP family protein [Brevibacillus borstelensis]MED2011144.1 LCP family protein [Brevibacillus borstelensis]WNF07371.1 LCP family protein [Brevibacillus borstelensis]